MGFKIGQKVETEKGNGIIVAISGYEEQLYIVEITKIGNWGFNEHQLKPYKTAHEKLIDMGFAYIENYHNYRLFHNEKTNEELYIYHNKTYDANINITLELSRILTQYLEEMEE